jgi:hypothetical protein
MEEGFSLPVIFKGEEIAFNARLVINGYLFRFIIIIDDRELVVEKDDEGNYRVVNYSPDIPMHVDMGLLEAIVKSLKKISE